MPKEISDGLERLTLRQQPCGEGVAKRVWTTPRKTGTLHRRLHERRHTGWTDSQMRSEAAKKHRLATNRRPLMVQIGRQRFGRTWVIALPHL